MDHQEHTVQCHYDVLSVDRNADAATIKKAHRKLALKVSL
jgi:curved DNA-binding protein CbpA